ncbi:MAG: extracellular solute-binding protein [Clostridia bacterium]|nr:extracellular solute-binding protein [Clostridia bacterium]
MKKTLSLILAGLLVLLTLSGCSKASKINTDDPVTLTIWHVYGSQTESPLNDSINEFNRTVGKEKGIVINVVSVSSSSAIDEALTAAAKGTPGVPALPDLFTAYPRVAEIIGYDNLLNWNDYFTEQELSAFVDEFIEEGYFKDKLLMLPVAKSTELLFLNQTLFDKFGSVANVSTESLSTFEGLFSACEKFYDWSHGQDMFQINDFYHYSLTGMESFGEEFIINGKLNLESDAFRKVWEPIAHAGIYGGLCLGDGYASDRWKTGEVISNIGSTAGILYLRDYVTYADNTTEDIETSILAYPRFENGKATVVHRGGGLFALKNENEQKNEAASVFAKWLTEKENSLGFVTKAGYLPVTNDAFDYLFANTDTVENEKYRSLYNAVNGMSDEYTYCEVTVFEGASDIQASFEKNVKSVLSVAHTEYLNRVADGENAGTVINELVSSTLSEIRNLYN